MLQRARHGWWLLRVGVLLGGLIGCAPTLAGKASFPVLSRASLPSGFEKVAEVDEQRCTHLALFFWSWGDDVNHEAIVTDLLEEHHGDAIADAELTYFQIPAILYIQTCARVQGTVVRRSAPPAASSTATEALASQLVVEEPGR